MYELKTDTGGGMFLHEGEKKTHHYRPMGTIFG